MSETVTLFEFILGSLDAKGVPTVKSVHEAGLFRRVQWCRTHDAPEHGDGCCVLASFSMSFRSADCRLVEVWQEVTP